MNSDWISCNILFKIKSEKNHKQEATWFFQILSLVEPIRNSRSETSRIGSIFTDPIWTDQVQMLYSRVAYK